MTGPLGGKAPGKVDDVVAFFRKFGKADDVADAGKVLDIIIPNHLILQMARALEIGFQDKVMILSMTLVLKS